MFCFDMFYGSFVSFLISISSYKRDFAFRKSPGTATIIFFSSNYLIARIPINPMQNIGGTNYGKPEIEIAEPGLISGLIAVSRPVVEGKAKTRIAAMLKIRIKRCSVACFAESLPPK